MRLRIPEAFADLFTPKRYKVYYGGRGGAKSWAFAIALLSMGMNRPIRVLCARELQVSIADSVHKLLSDIINAHEGMGAFYEVQNKAIIGNNGTEFSFKGLKHNSNEIKSYEGVDYVWVEEAQAVSDKSWEILIPTIRKDGSEIWICFNPKNATDPTYQRFVTNKRDGSIVRKVGWRDNPFFPAVLEEERQHLLKTDPEAYDHIWEGDFDTRYSGAVYAKWVRQEQISTLVRHDPNYPVYTAWDLGYGDTTAIVFYQIGNGEVFIIDYYETNQEDVHHYCQALYGKEIIVNERDMKTGDVLDWRFGEPMEEHKHRMEYNYHPDRAHNVPHDADNKIMAAGGKSIVEQARKFGIRMIVWAAASQIDSQEALRSVLPRCWINQETAADFVQSLMHYHYEYDDDRKIYSKVPVHDWSSNGCDAGEIMARAYRDKAVTMTQIDRQLTEREFYRKRRENKMDMTDPYRVKPVMKKGKR